ncbi:MAG: hypothetical protein HYT62_02095 [Candidatus Yanofskybacteria bacterium]|nr:hypothetical protein [Candidatus Yanofskybacteria bacterium]
MEKERIKITNSAESANAKIKGLYECYAGVCDVISPEQARAMAEELRRNRKNPDRKVMIGVMTGHFALRPDKDDPGEQRSVFPSREEISLGFTDDPDVLNTVHFADLYRPREAQTLLDDLELIVEYGGEHLHAIQLDVTWPDPDEIDKFKEAHPELKIILQIGQTALNEAGKDPQKVVELLDRYGDSIDFVLLDMSMGKGKNMESEGLLPLLRLIQKELPGLGLAVAGGLGPDSMEPLEPVAKEFPGISIDAQGRLKPPGAKADSLGHIISTTPANLDRSNDYIRKSCAMLDNPKEE